jgi:hypothetical protein
MLGKKTVVQKVPGMVEMSAGLLELVMVGQLEIEMVGP